MTAGVCSLTVTVQSQNAAGTPTNVLSSTPVSLSTTSTGGAFYSDAGCTTAITSVTIPGGSNSASFYYKDTKAGAPTITASATGLTSATQTETVNAAAPSKLVFTTLAQTLTAGVCSATITVQTQDTFGNPSSVAAATAVSLSTTSTGGAFYSDAGCTTAITFVTVATGANTASFYYGDTLANGAPGLPPHATPTLTASAIGLTPDTQKETVNPSAPTKLVIVSQSLSQNPRTCSSTIQIHVEDKFGNNSPVSAATTVTLSTTSTGGIFFKSTTGCTTPVTSVTVLATSYLVGFLYNDTTPGFPTITVSAIGLVSASQTESIVLPIGVITTSVPKSLVGQTVYFNATASFDPDGESIMNYSWSFGDQSPTVTGNSTFRVYSHVYLYAGNFTVTLTVIDNNGSNGASNSTTILFRVDRPSIRIVSATLSTTTGTVGDTITMTVDVLNDGTISETFTVSMDANNLTVAFKTVTLTPGQSENVQLTWNTLGYSSGAFTIKARVLGATVPIAQSPLENAGQVTLASQNTFIGSITFWIIIGIVVAAAAVVTILLRRRRTIPTV
jgi:hypothetical protein